MSSGPMVVLSEESQRASGDDALSMNLAAAQAVGDAVRTTLGPRGMDKMLVDESGNVVVTNDGVTLLEEMDVDHPAADTLVDVATTQESEVGDGTTSAVVLASELLSEAEDLVESGVHPSTIVAGYRTATEVALDALAAVAIDVDPDDAETVADVAATAMTGKGAEQARGLLSSLVVDGVRAATREDGTVDEDAVIIRQFYGGSIDDSRFVSGILFDHLPCHQNMARAHSDADILVYEGDIEVTELEVDAEATVGSYDEYGSYVEREQAELEAAVEKIVDAGVDVLVTEGGIDDYAQQLLVEAGITAFTRIDDYKRERVAKATGGSLVGNLDTLTEDDLGFVGTLEQEVIREYTFRRQADKEKTMVFSDLPTGEFGTILLRGSTEHVLDEVERAVEDAVGVATAAVEDGAVLPGGGAPEIGVSLALREAASGVEGREQLAVEAYAEAIEEGPRILAENAGHDAIDALVELTASHDEGNTATGIDAETGEVVDMLEAGVVEPLRVKTTAVNSALDASSTILRIDDVISAGDLSVGDDEEDEGGAPGGAGGMGGMGGGMGGMM
ncbi:MAG: thermosome subunit alpha [Haloarculaceae archaeon]